MNNTIKFYLNRIILSSIGIFLSISLTAQQWKPAMEGINISNGGNIGSHFHLEFKNDILDKDWVYGGYWDEDSLRRCVAYREGGKWVPLPFSCYKASKASDMVMYNDTLYITGSFGDIVLDKDSSSLPNTGIIKWFNDSLWVAGLDVSTGSGSKMTVKGDSLLIWGGAYYSPPTIIYSHFMTTDGGASWQYPYSIIHPTETNADFGAHFRLKILDNGDIVTLNNGSPGNSGYKGIIRWDGMQWHTYGTPTYGSTSRVFDFEYYKGELYIGGTFNQYDFPSDPGNFIAKWNGTEWHSVATGTDQFVSDLFVYKDVLYCRKNGGTRFGDAGIGFFGGWDGTQWCGTHFQYSPAPVSFGFVNDTLFATFYAPGNINGDTISYMNYYDGDILHGPNAVCSTPGLGKKENALNPLQLYPNPVEGLLHIEINSSFIEQIDILDVSGALIFSETYPYKPNSLEVNLSHFQSGTYIVRVNEQYHQVLLK